jgi:hypothetical protein
MLPAAMLREENGVLHLFNDVSPEDDTADTADAADAASEQNHQVSEGSAVSSLSSTDDTATARDASGEFNDLTETASAVSAVSSIPETQQRNNPYSPDTFEAEVWDLHQAHPKRKAKWISGKLGRSASSVQLVIDAIDQVAKSQPEAEDATPADGADA